MGADGGEAYETAVKRVTCVPADDSDWPIAGPLLPLLDFGDERDHAGAGWRLLLVFPTSEVEKLRPQLLLRSLIHRKNRSFGKNALRYIRSHDEIPNLIISPRCFSSTITTDLTLSLPSSKSTDVAFMIFMMGQTI